MQVDDACANIKKRGARVVAISTQAIVLADTANPTGGFTTADYQRFAARFDTLVYPLDVNNFGGPGTNAQIWSCNGGTSQQWAAHNDGGNIYEFEPECSFGSRLDVLNGSSGNGTQVRIWYANGASAQKWAVN